MIPALSIQKLEKSFNVMKRKVSDKGDGVVKKALASQCV